MANSIESIAIVGAGTMGAGIAQVAAQAGLQVVLYDLETAALENAKAKIITNLEGGISRGKLTEDDKAVTLDRITFTHAFDKVVADIIVEAVIENLELKHKIFTDLAAQNANETLLASNTSSIPITQIASIIPHPERVVGMHFFNPVHIMKLVEVISGDATAPQVVQQVKTLAERMGKKAVLAADSPGFIVNRVARPFYVEALKILEEQVADVTTIDALMHASGFKMGPFQLMDLIGVDSNHYTTQSMYKAFFEEPRFRPSRIQEKMVLAGRHGRKSGSGFYDYSK